MEKNSGRRDRRPACESSGIFTRDIVSDCSV